MRQWLDKCRWKLARWMQGRYGQDSLSLTLLIAALALTFLSSVIRAAYWLSSAIRVLAAVENAGNALGRQVEIEPQRLQHVRSAR